MVSNKLIVALLIVAILLFAFTIILNLSIGNNYYGVGSDIVGNNQGSIGVVVAKNPLAGAEGGVNVGGEE